MENNAVFSKDLTDKIERFKNIINEGNISKIRAFLDDNISWNSTELEYLNYCVELALKVEGVFDETSSIEARHENEWDRDYLYYLQSQQLSEYSLSRYYHIVKVQNFLDERNICVEFKDESDQQEDECKNTYLIQGGKDINFTLAVGTGITIATIVGVYLLQRRRRRSKNMTRR